MTYQSKLALAFSFSLVAFFWLAFIGVCVTSCRK